MLRSRKTDVHYMYCCCYCDVLLVFLALIVNSAFERYLVYFAELLAPHDNRRHLTLHNYRNTSQRISNHWLLKIQKIQIQEPLHKSITFARTQVSLTDVVVVNVWTTLITAVVLCLYNTHLYLSPHSTKDLMCKQKTEILGFGCLDFFFPDLINTPDI